MIDWYSDFSAAFGDFPRTYLVVDTETTGLDVRVDLPLQIGCLLIRDGGLELQGVHLLNWYAHAGICPRWLSARLERVRTSLNASGKPYRFTRELLETEGKNPDRVLAAFLSLCRQHAASGGFFVGHNFLRFDRPLLEATFRNHLQENWRFPENAIFDSGLLAKAKLLRVSPHYGETLADYQWRVAQMRLPRGESWSLEACAERLPPDRNIKRAEMHDALYDCWVSWQVLEAHREKR